MTRQGGISRRGFTELSYSIFRGIEQTGCKIEVTGTSSIGALSGKPCVYVANHMSLVETTVLPCVLEAFSSLSIVAKRSLATYPGFGKCLAAVNPILLDRKSARVDLAETISQGSERIRGGASVLLFPQGSRCKVFETRRFNTLGAKLAREAGVPIVPIACKTDYISIGRLIKDLGAVDPSKTVRFAIGPAIDSSLSQAEVHKACIDFITNKLMEWGAPCAEPSAKENQ